MRCRLVPLPETKMERRFIVRSEELELRGFDFDGDFVVGLEVEPNIIFIA